MIIIRIMGGLGNQLQQYALYEKMKSIGKEVRIDICEYEHSELMGTPRELELDFFQNVDYQVCTMEEKALLVGDGSILDRIRLRLMPWKRRYYKETPIMYDKKILSFQDMYLEGYWACEKYYIDIIEILRTKLVFPIEVGGNNDICAKKMQMEESVSIHLRRGDYFNPENIDVFGGICTEDYYKSAVGYVMQLSQSPHFYIFSDDIEYAKKKYVGEQYTIVDWNVGKDSYFDIYLMSQCKYNICANSTFSFWGARLNSREDKVSIRPLKQKNSNQYQPDIMKELWSGWILIDEKGKLV